MPDHFFDELDRDEVDLFTDDGESIRSKLQQWLKFAPTPLQEEIALQKVNQITQLANDLGFRVSARGLREGRSMVTRAVLLDARGRVIARGAKRVVQFLNEAGF